MNPINRELREYRNMIEHYTRILKEDQWIKIGELEDDGRPKLSNDDISKIKLKIESLEEQRNDLLKQEKDYAEIVY